MRNPLVFKSIVKGGNPKSGFAAKTRNKPSAAEAQPNQRGSEEKAGNGRGMFGRGIKLQFLLPIPLPPIPLPNPPENEGL
jgi:hypothetical protein